MVSQSDADTSSHTTGRIAAEKCAFRRHPRGAFGVELRALRSHEAAQGFHVIGKRGSVVWHPKLVS